MAARTLLWLLGASLAVVALVFFVIGFMRRGADVATTRERDRAGVTRRADWWSAASLLALALVAFIGGAGAARAFPEPTGNVAGGVVLIATVVFVILVAVLFARHAIVSRALRRLRTGAVNDARRPDAP